MPQSSARATGSARKAPAYGLSRRSSMCFTDSKAAPKDWLGASRHTADGASPAAVRWLTSTPESLHVCCALRKSFHEWDRLL